MAPTVDREGTMESTTPREMISGAMTDLGNLKLALIEAISHRRYFSPGRVISEMVRVPEAVAAKRSGDGNARQEVVVGESSNRQRTVLSPLARL